MSKRLMLRFALVTIKILSRILSNTCGRDYQELAPEISSVVRSITEELQEAE